MDSFHSRMMTPATMAARGSQRLYEVEWIGTYRFRGSSGRGQERHRQVETKLSKNVKFTVTGESLRIELMEKDGGLFFETGSRRFYVYSRVRDVIESIADLANELFHRVEAASPSVSVVTMLNLDGKMPPLGRVILKESINGAYVAGAYFYRFQPKTFAKAS